jgi:DNA-binding response OmpR family regulator
MVAKLNIVVVEDNDDLRNLTCQVLHNEGHHAIGLACAEDLEDLGGGKPVDIFLIDINLPGENGISLSKRIRNAQPSVGIIIVSARTDLDDKVIGYDSGADLYITKPVVFAELTAAIRSFARRHEASRLGKANDTQTLTLDKLDVTGSAGVVKLTATEAMLLTALARAPAGKLDTWQIAEMLEVPVDETMKASIVMRIVRLRKKLSEAGAEGIAIESIRNVGYQLLVHIEVN